MTILKEGVDGFSYFSMISVILFSNQDYPCNNKQLFMDKNHHTPTKPCNNKQLFMDKNHHIPTKPCNNKQLFMDKNHHTPTKDI